MADGLDFKIESAFVLYIEEHWHRFGSFPSDRDINNTLGLTAPQIAELISRKGVQASLDRRGIVVSADEGFTAIQLAAINTYLNVSDQRTDRTKLKDLGITINQWNGWWRDPKFRKYVLDRSNDIFNNETLANAQMAVSKRVKSGDPRMLKLFFDIRKADSDSQGIQDVKQFMSQVIETIQRHVPDENVLKAIALDFEYILMGNKPMISGAIEASSPPFLDKMADQQLAKGKEIDI